MWWIRKLSAGKISIIVPTGGGGSLFLHKLTITHVTLRKKLRGMSGLINVNSGGTSPRLITKSLDAGPSPIIFPGQRKFIITKNNNYKARNWKN